ncbi:MAG: rRNA pseudouridine synthase [Gemmatimonadota bacterium]|nr:rRNA pseudouridine synthase [Gemmatimonadota bacterium]MDE3216119.1 rRNA pseudouridine synthase [Gemmatimonadota bacterium]
MSDAMRIQRALARAGVASRRGAEELVAAGRVTVNGAVARVGQTVRPGADAIAVDGRPVGAQPSTVWYVLHKPAGVMTTKSDPQGRRTVYDLVPPAPGLVYVGRLDYLTEGVLLMTTDGTAAHALTHPRHEVERTYVATVRGDAPRAVVAARGGVRLEDGMVQPRAVEARRLGGGQWAFEVTIAEGRKREVRRLCTALGLGVDRLVRTRFGPVELGALPSGQVRQLTPRERRAIDAIVAGAPA